MDLRHATGADVRRRARLGELTGPTPGLALGYVQANLVVVPRDLAFDFLLFCQRNPKPCPLLDVTEPGSAEPRLVAPGADLRDDLPRYRVYRHGELVDEPTSLRAWWRDDLVGFLLGCSFTFESALLQAGVPVHFGDPAAIGVRDLGRPDFGDPVEVRTGEVPVFWACGVTPQAVATEARPPLLLTHKPGHMFVTDLRDTDLEGE